MEDWEEGREEGVMGMSGMGKKMVANVWTVQ